MKIPFLLSLLLHSISYSNPYIIIQPIDPVLNTFEEDCVNFGISIDEGWSLVDNHTNPRTFKSFTKVRTDVNRLQYQTDVHHAILRYEDTNTYSYICRIAINPVSKSRYWGVLGIGSHSDNWYFRKLNVSFDLPTDCYIGQWAPMNQPNIYENELSLSVGINDVSIGTTISVTESLEIISRTNPVTNHFETEYSYLPLDNYSNNSIIFFTSFTFNCSNFSIDSLPPFQFTTVYYGSFFNEETHEFDVYPYYLNVTE